MHPVFVDIGGLAGHCPRVHVVYSEKRSASSPGCPGTIDYSVIVIKRKCFGDGIIKLYLYAFVAICRYSR